MPIGSLRGTSVDRESEISRSRAQLSQSKRSKLDRDSRLLVDSNFDESSGLIGTGLEGPAPVMVGLPGRVANGKAEKSGNSNSRDFNRITALEDLSRETLARETRAQTGLIRETRYETNGMNTPEMDFSRDD